MFSCLHPVEPNDQFGIRGAGGYQTLPARPPEIDNSDLEGEHKAGRLFMILWCASCEVYQKFLATWPGCWFGCLICSVGGESVSNWYPPTHPGPLKLAYAGGVEDEFGGAFGL